MSRSELGNLNRVSPDTSHSMVRSENAAPLGDLGIELQDRLGCSLHSANCRLCPSSTNTDSSPLILHSDGQLSDQQGYNQSPTRKRKYQVTTMAEFPLKLRISRTDGRSFGLDGSSDNPSPWDALAGEDSHSDSAEPVPDRCAVPSWQLAASDEQTALSQPTVHPAHPQSLREGDELYEVCLCALIRGPY